MSPNISTFVDSLRVQVRQAPAASRHGRVVAVTGLVIESDGPNVGLQEMCLLQSDRGDFDLLAEVVGFRGERVLLMPLGDTAGLHPGCLVVACDRPTAPRATPALFGRVLDALGRPFDAGAPVPTARQTESSSQPPHPLKRQRIREALSTGVRAIDVFTPLGLGQRMGLFAGSGVGKSTLLGMIARSAQADVVVIGLVGERGREVREFLEKDLGPEGMKRAVVVVATSDSAAPLRLRAAATATAIAEGYREQGLKVMLLLDSITRYAMAQREIGLAVGEPPTTRGYTPSVFAKLPRLLERTGAGEQGSITALYTVLVEGDDMNEPIADAVRGILDGHLVLSRTLAQANHFPAIDVLNSVSRLAQDICQPEQLAAVADARDQFALYRRNEDLITVGAYQAGANPALDRAVKLNQPLTQYLRQATDESMPREDSFAQIQQLLAA
jgi:flagellum-specific ATP synthase